MAANTPTTYYKDSFAAIESCKTDFDKIKKIAAPITKKANPVSRKRLGRLFGNCWVENIRKKIWVDPYKRGN